MAKHLMGFLPESARVPFIKKLAANLNGGGTAIVAVQMPEGRQFSERRGRTNAVVDGTTITTTSSAETSFSKHYFTSEEIDVLLKKADLGTGYEATVEIVDESVDALFSTPSLILVITRS